MLFVRGPKDAFGTPPELRTFLDVLPARSTLPVVEGGDHSFAVPKRSGVQPGEILRSDTRAVAGRSPRTPAHDRRDAPSAD